MIVSSRAARTLALLSLASLGWAFSFGLGAPLASLWLRDAGCSAGTIGLNTSLYYLGVALASPLVPLLMRRANRWCVAAGMTLDAVATALFPWATGPVAWGLLRFLAGAGTALSLIPLETRVNHNAPDDRRARDFAVYAVSVALGIGLGSLVGLPLYPLAPRTAFLLGGLATLLAILPAWKETAPTCSTAVPSKPFRLDLGDGALSLGTAWVQGFLEGGMVAFLAIYLCGLGYVEGQVSGLMAGLFLGVILAQLPVACLADYLGRLRVLLVCHGAILAGLVCLPFLHAPLGVAAWLFVLGACCGALYPLGLAVLGERVPREGLASANAWYLASNCAGSLSGPLVMGLAIDAFGPRAHFAVGAVVLILVVGTGAALRLQRQTVTTPWRKDRRAA
jgi:MFS family permease